MKLDYHNIESLVTPIVEAMGYMVWHIDLHKVQRKTLVRIYVDVLPSDSRKSISVDDCSNISRQISAVFDIEEPILGSYILEVSSPGLNRQLFTFEHYQRYIGSMVRVILHQPLEGTTERQQVFTGKIQGICNNTLKLGVSDHSVDIDLLNVKKANLFSV